MNTLVIAQYPTLKFANGIGSTLNEEGHAVAIDASGTNYITGRFAGLADFDPSGATATLNPVGSADIYLACYKNNGQYQWAFNIGGLNADAGNDITLSPMGYIYIVGDFSGVADFDPSPATATLSAPGFQNNMFLAKYSSNGVYQWAISIGGNTSETANSVCIDAAGNILVTGSFENTVDFDPSASVYNLTSTGGSDVFVAKYSSSGNFINAVGFGSTTNDVGNSICVDATSNIYLCGNFTGTIDLNPGLGSTNFTSNGQEDIFISKFTNALSFSWGFGTGSTLSDNCYTIGSDGSCNSIYIGGDFFNSMDVDPGPGVTLLSSSGSLDAFVANYDLNGNYQSAFKIGNSGSAESVRDITFDSNCYFYITGAFNGVNVDFDPGAGTTNLTTLGSTDIFVANYKSGNTLQWAFSVGDFSSDYGFGIAINNSGELSVTGQFFGNSCDFDPFTPTITPTNAGGNDIFLADYDSKTITALNNTITESPSLKLISNNPGNIFTISSHKNYHLVVIDLNGKTVIEKDVESGKTNLDLSEQPNGLYLLKFSDSKTTISTKVIKQ